jgi:hypothetical protein
MHRLVSASLTVVFASFFCFPGSTAHAALSCEVTFSIQPTESISTVDITVDYSSAVGTFDGSGFGVQCTALTEDTALIARDACSSPDNYCYFGAGRSLYLVASRSTGFDQDGDLVSCTFTSPEGQTPTVDQFSATIRSAESLTTLDDTTNLPSVRVNAVTCAN